MDEVRDGPAHDSTRADSEQALGRRVEVSDRERVVENDERRRETLKDAARFGCATAAARTADRVEGAG
jgi:hypothetical protein